VALASAGAVVASLVTGFVAASVAVATSSDSGVTFSSQHGVAALLAHYTVSPADHEGSDVSNEESRTGTLAPKEDGKSKAARAAATDLSAGATSDNTNAEPTQGSESASRAASFIGQQASATTCSYFGKGCNPPDMALAASPQWVLQGVNTQFEVLDTSGNVQPGWPVGAQAFFGVPNVTMADGETPCDVAHKSQPFVSDPRALYDPIDGRFWAAALQLENGIGIAPDCPFKAVYFVSVSQTSDPSGTWNVYEFEMSMGQHPIGTQNLIADYTQLGINRDAVYFSANMFTDTTGQFPYAELFEANKAKMEKGQGHFTADGFFNLRANGPGLNATTGPFLADTMNPALNVDTSAGGTEVFVDLLDGPDPVSGHGCTSAADACKGLILWKMTNPVGHDHGGSAPVLTGTYVPNVKPYVFSPPADQPSCNACVDALDLRVTATPVVRGGNVYAGWETAINNGTQIVPGIEWAQVSISDSSAESGYYNFSGDTAVSFPALMPDGNGNLVMLFDLMSHTVFPQTRYVIREGRGQFTGQGVLIKAGEDSYRPQLCGTLHGVPPAPFICRWGDFSASSFDGQGGIWVAGEYANHYDGIPNPPAFGRNWGTWIASVRTGGGG
jgi:hypothetical protein